MWTELNLKIKQYCLVQIFHHMWIHLLVILVILLQHKYVCIINSHRGAIAFNLRIYIAPLHSRWLIRSTPWLFNRPKQVWLEAVRVSHFYFGRGCWRSSERGALHQSPVSVSPQWYRDFKCNWVQQLHTVNKTSIMLIQ